MKSLFVTVLLGLTAVTVYAQPHDPAFPPGPLPGPEHQPGPLPPPLPPGGERVSDAELSELIQSVMAAKLSRELGLNEEQTVLMVRRFSEFREELNAMKRQRQEKMKALRTALREDKPDELIERTLNELVEHDQHILEMRRNAYERAAGELSMRQRAKLYVFLSDFEGDMRKLIQKTRQHRQGLNRPFQAGFPTDAPPPQDRPPRAPRPQRPSRPPVPPDQTVR